MAGKVIKYHIEYKPIGWYHYHKRSGLDRFYEKELALEVAQRTIKDNPGLGVRVVETTRRIIKVFK